MKHWRTLGVPSCERLARVVAASEVAYSPCLPHVKRVASVAKSPYRSSLGENLESFCLAGYDATRRSERSGGICFSHAVHRNPHLE